MVRRDVALGAAAIVAVCAFAFWAARAPDGPAPVAFDRVACAHCRMLVSDPRFAAQVQLADGEVLQFDDPGCLLIARAAEKRRVRAVWFHDSVGAGWIAESEVAFVRERTTPMGYGFAAVRAGRVAGALDEAAVLAALAGKR
jgi:copper chaperone NosL